MLSLFDKYSFGWRGVENERAMKVLFAEDLPVHGMNCAYAAINFYVMHVVSVTSNQQPMSVLNICDFNRRVEVCGIDLTSKQRCVLNMLSKFKYVLGTATFDDDDLVQFTKAELDETALLVHDLYSVATRAELQWRHTEAQNTTTILPLKI